MDSLLERSIWQFRQPWLSLTRPPGQIQRLEGLFTDHCDNGSPSVLFCGKTAAAPDKTGVAWGCTPLRGAKVPMHASATSALTAGCVADALAAAGLAPDTSPRRLAEYSFDAANYRLVPQAVLFPRTATDVATAARICHEHAVPLTARGGGTSMAGNAISRGVFLDLFRHMTAVSAVDDTARTVHAEAAVVLSELRTAVHAATVQRLTFAPDPSSHARARLGGARGERCPRQSFGQVRQHQRSRGGAACRGSQRHPVNGHEQRRARHRSRRWCSRAHSPPRRGLATRHTPI